MTAAAALMLLLTATTAAASPRLTEQQARGKRIYVSGESTSGTPIVALMGGEGMELPASVVPCASCHGYDGRGRAEGGVRPSNLRWDVLTKPYEVPGERSHPPYSRSSVRRAVTLGVDPAGNKLQVAMPRYRMTQRDMEDLLAYLEKLPEDVDPGLSEEAVRIGVIVPEGAAGAQAKEQVETYLDAVARAGGVFGRKIEARFTTGDVQSFIEREDLFALVAGTLMNDAAAEANQMPTIAGTGRDVPRGRYTFSLLPTLREQALTLAEHASRHARSPVIVFAGATPWRELALEISAKTLVPAITADAPRAEHDALVVLGPPELHGDVLNAASAVDRPPLVLLAGGARASLPAQLSGRVVVATPALSEEVAAMAVLIEALRRSGRDVSREKVVQTLEGFYEVDLGRAAKITFGPSRRVGMKAPQPLVWSAQ